MKFKKAALMGGFLNGAGSIRAYPHAENTGLIISDAAKIDIISDTFKFWSNEFKKRLFSNKPHTHLSSPWNTDNQWLYETGGAS